jgi:capsular polysaccharide biosynthesis protein
MSRTVHLVRRVGPPVCVVALTVLVGGTAGYVYSRKAPPNYAARAYVVVTATDPGDAQTAVNFAQAYARVAGQGDVLSLAVTASGGKITVDELAAGVQASSSPDAPMIEVTGSAVNATKAALIANSVANGLIATAAKQSTTTRMTLSMLSAAVPPTTVTSPPRPRIGAAIGAAGGLLLGLLALLAGIGRVGRSNRRSIRQRPVPTNSARLWSPLPDASPAAPTLPAAPRGPRDDVEPTR